MYMALAASFAVTFVWLGFVCHTSSGPTVLMGKYSYVYAAWLAAATAGCLALLMIVWRERAALTKSTAKALLMAGITALAVWLVLPVAYIWIHQDALNRDVFSPLREGAHAFFQIESAPDPPAQVTPGALRVLALGESTTYGFQLNREDAYPAVLERVLQEHYQGREVDVLNAGVPWHTSMHSLLRYVARYSEWKPHVVIVMHGFNDIYQASEGRLTTGKFREDYGHFFGALGNRVNPVDHLNAALSQHLRNNWLSRVWFSDFRRPLTETPRPMVDLLRALPSFRRNLANIVRRARDDGATVVVLNQPYLYHEQLTAEDQKRFFYSYYYADYAQVPGIYEQRRAMNAFNTVSREVASAQGAIFVDLEAMIPKSTDMMFDDVHYTIAGARAVAEAVAGAVPWEAALQSAASRRHAASSPW